jgi:glycerol-1-phosphate dehydrogenase [NAD(P)+]
MEISVPSLLRIKPKALHKLGKYLKQEGFQKIALYWGVGVKDLFNDVIEISFATASIEILYEQVVVSNDIDFAFASGKELPSNVQAMVAIGGGMAIDFCKYVAFSRQLKMVSVPTLVSNDALASPTSSLTVNGARKTVLSIVPYGVIIDTGVILNAPKQFLFSGIGDLFCKTTAVFDWKLAYKKTGESVNDFAATVATSAADTFTYYKNKDTNDIEFVGIVATSLLMTGIAMIIAGNSRPASGAEHLISHAYDKVAAKPSLHGLQVGVASYGVSFLQQITHERVKRDILESGFFDFMKEHPLSREDFLHAVGIAPEIKENFYTILSEKGNLTKLRDFIQNDELMQQMLV